MEIAMRMSRRHCAAVLAALWLFSLASAALAAAPDGKALYATKCAMCHGTDGTAAEMWSKKGAPNFNDAAWQKGRPTTPSRRASWTAIRRR